MRKPRDEFSLKRKLRFLFLTNPFMIYKTFNGQIITRDATKILICCIYDINDMFYFGHEIQTNFIDAYLEKEMSHIEIFSALTYLEKLGLIQDLRGNKDKYFFSPTHEAIHFFEIRRKNFIYLLLSSIVLPIAVSIATTIITLLISGALQAW